MNLENYNYLATQLQFKGFPETLNEGLKQKMQENPNAFVLTLEQKTNKEEANATLFFKKGEESDKYFFNSYHLNLKTENNPEGISQTFYIDNKKRQEGQENHKKDFTLKEAVNLLTKAENKDEQRFVYGRWAKRNGELYNAWKGINFNELDKNGNHEFLTFHDNYGFNLEKSLKSLPIREADKSSQELIKGLQKGNLQQAKTEDGQTIYLSAFPPARKINTYDKDMILVNTMNSSQDQFQSHKSISPTNGMKQTPAKGESIEQSPANTAVQETKAQKTNKKKVEHAGDDLESSSNRRMKRSRR